MMSSISGMSVPMIKTHYAEFPQSISVPSVAEVSARKTAEKPKDIVHAFTATERRFGEHFDVSTHAAVIQMMMLRFGQRPTDVFDHFTPSVSGYDVTMKDGFKVHLTQDEFLRASRATRFVGNDRGAINDANFIFAAFVKRK